MVRGALCALAVAAILAAAGCRTGPKTQESKAMIIAIEETSLVELGGVPTGMGNMGQGAYALPDGTERQGMTATLFPGEEGFFVVGEGSELEIGGVRWRVLEVTKAKGEMGSVRLQQVGTGDGASVDPNADLDYGYSTRCPRCGSLAGWTGVFEKQWDDQVLAMRCPSCANEFVWYDGALKEPIARGEVQHVPGRSRG